jgi:hypothetical protein
MIDPDNPLAASPIPFVYWQDEVASVGTGIAFPTRYYVWFFGLSFRLPFESYPSSKVRCGGPARIRGAGQDMFGAEDLD